MQGQTHAHTPYPIGKIIVPGGYLPYGQQQQQQEPWDREQGAWDYPMKTDEAFEEWSRSPEWNPNGDPRPPPYPPPQRQRPPPPRRSHTTRKPPRRRVNIR